MFFIFLLKSCYQLEPRYDCFPSNLDAGKPVVAEVLWHGKLLIHSLLCLFVVRSCVRVLLSSCACVSLFLNCLFFCSFTCVCLLARDLLYGLLFIAFFLSFQPNRYLALPWLFWEILMLVYAFALTVFFITIWHGVSDFCLVIYCSTYKTRTNDEIVLKKCNSKPKILCIVLD